MSLRLPSSGGGSGRTISHDMIRFTPDDSNMAASMSPLRLGDSTTPGSGDYGVASDRSQVGSLCRHRARRLGDPSAWLDDPAGPYATYYCSCRRDRREPRARTTNAATDDDDGPTGDVLPPDVAAGPVYGVPTGTVSRPSCGHPRQHVVVCTTAADKIYQERYASSCKYSTFLGGNDTQSRLPRNTVDHPHTAAENGLSSSVAVDTEPVNL